MDFVLSLRINANDSTLKLQGMQQYTVLVRKIFSIREKIEVSTFPFEWIEFNGAPYPTEALWVIEWYDPDSNDFDHPVNELLKVYGNKRLDKPLTDLGRVRTARDLAWKMLAADITTQIWSHVLLKIEIENLPDTEDTRTLAGQIFTRISRMTEKTYAEIKGLMEQNDGGAELRTLVAGILKVIP